MIKLIFHVGMAKCGSTSLQKFLMLNQDKLDSNRILYPTNLNHNFLLGLIGKGTRVHSPDKLKVKCQLFLADLKQLVAVKSVDTIIFSSELILGLANDQRELIYRKIVDIAKEKDPDVQIVTIVFYRPLHETYLSANIQRLKGFHEINIYKPGRMIKTPELLDHLRLISNRLRVVPLSSLGSKTTLQQTFFDLCEIELSSSNPLIFDSPSIENKALSAESTIALQRWQKNNNSVKENKLTKLSKKFVQLLAQIEKEHDVTKALLKTELALTIGSDELQAYKNHTFNYPDICDTIDNGLEKINQSRQHEIKPLDSSIFDPYDFRSIVKYYDQKIADHIFDLAMRQIKE